MIEISHSVGTSPQLPRRVTLINTRMVPSFSTDDYEARALDLNVKPWNWPRSLPTDLGNGKDFQLVAETGGPRPTATYSQPESSTRLLIVT